MLSKTLDPVLRAAVLLAIVALAVSGVWSARGLYGDGAYFLLQILKTDGFWTTDPPRLFANLILQAPVVAALEAGVADLNGLIRLHSAALVVLPLAAWTGALLVLFRSRCFWLLVWAFAATYLDSGFFAAGEYNLTYAMAALCAAILVQDGPLRTGGVVVLVALAAALTRSYEATVFLGPLLCGASLVRLVRRDDASAVTRTGLGLAAVLFVVGAAVAAWSILSPSSPGNMAGAAAVKQVLRSPQVVYTCLMSIAVLVALVSRRPSSRRAALIGAAVLSVVFVAMPMLWLPPDMHYLSRAVAGLGLFGILLVTIVWRFSASLGWRPVAEPDAAVSGVALLLLGSLLIPFLVHTVGFRDWARTFESEVTTRTGRVPIEATAVYRGGLFEGYNWPWTNPALSVLLRAGPASAVIINPVVYRGWQPDEQAHALAPRFARREPLFR
ncbi:MAG: hypothetical protein HXX10_09875 [Rhodoplanes sp.]|uniref:hypothetical protein n=1 Tax=Rhodoplanes sp. TaxID=1968906 RepID=UPI0018476C82|nr:hypothetical protein [Rhodoplanes sp.]NVO14331.1 hypothetical protein [Rhodoplanes sp.]